MEVDDERIGGATAVLDGVPAEGGGGDGSDALGVVIEDAGAVGGEEPLVAGGDEEVTGVDLDGGEAKRVGGVDGEESAGEWARAISAQRVRSRRWPVR